MQARFVGSRRLIARDEQGVEFPLFVQYPTEQPSRPTGFGPYTLEVSVDAPLAAGSFPLLLLSHGGGSTPFAYRTLSLHLARSGYIVGLPEHPGDNRHDRSLSDTLINFARRPRHLALAIDLIAQEPHFAASTRTHAVGVIGHSLGGYTALAIAGGVPWARTGERIAAHRDPRVGALALLAPAVAFYMPPDALSAVRASVLALTAEHDAITPPALTREILQRLTNAARVSCRTIDNAGHFSFLSPFPAELSGPQFAPSIDPPGFDRARFHAWLPGELQRYFDAELAPMR